MQVAFYLAGEITQVKESIPGVRCASGNVCLSGCFVFLSTYSNIFIRGKTIQTSSQAPRCASWKADYMIVAES